MSPQPEKGPVPPTAPEILSLPRRRRSPMGLSEPSPHGATSITYSVYGAGSRLRRSGCGSTETPPPRTSPWMPSALGRSFMVDQTGCLCGQRLGCVIDSREGIGAFVLAEKGILLSEPWPFAFSVFFRFPPEQALGTAKAGGRRGSPSRSVSASTFRRRSRSS